LHFGIYKFTCNTDSNMNPYADCLNSMAIICNTSDPTFIKTRCQTGINQMFAGMSAHWQNVRQDCGRWPFTRNGITYTGVYPSDNCASANKNLIANAFYIQKDGSKVRVDSQITESTNVRLWSKVTA